MSEEVTFEVRSEGKERATPQDKLGETLVRQREWFMQMFKIAAVHMTEIKRKPEFILTYVFVSVSMCVCVRVCLHAFIHKRAHTHTQNDDRDQH